MKLSMKKKIILKILGDKYKEHTIEKPMGGNFGCSIKS